MEHKETRSPRPDTQHAMNQQLHIVALQQSRPATLDAQQSQPSRRDTEEEKKKKTFPNNNPPLLSPHYNVLDMLPGLRNQRAID